MLNIEKILFLLEIKNWNLQYDEFSQKFNEINGLIIALELEKTAIFVHNLGKIF